MRDRRVNYRRRSPSLYLLWIDGRLLDTYIRANNVWEAAQRYMERGKWKASRPGKWWNDRGQCLEIETRELR